jgi:hypothetical protein
MMGLAISRAFTISGTLSAFIVSLPDIAKEPMSSACCPQLATYLGRVHLAATQRYLTMTPELLQQANQRFERYAGEVAQG